MYNDVKRENVLRLSEKVEEYIHVVGYWMKRVGKVERRHAAIVSRIGSVLWATKQLIIIVIMARQVYF